MGSDIRTETEKGWSKFRIVIFVDNFLLLYYNVIKRGKGLNL